MSNGLNGQRWQVIEGDCLDVLRGMADCSVDAVVTDPPAGIAFMGREWDGDKGGRDKWIGWMREVAVECLRVIKPGGHALVWAIPRTSHWTGMAWETAGWDARDKVFHCFGSGFPKSLDVGKALDCMAGAEREVISVNKHVDRYPNGPGGVGFHGGVGEYTQHGRPPEPLTAPATDAAKRWDGWGTALKPAVEEWWLFRRPLEGTVAANVLHWGTGALNIGATRVAGVPEATRFDPARHNHDGWRMKATGAECAANASPKGRWPANLVHDGSEEVLALFPVTTSGRLQTHHKRTGKAKIGTFEIRDRTGESCDFGGDTGSAARFFQRCPDDDPEDAQARRLVYCAKASKRDRDEGCEGLEEKDYKFSTRTPQCPECGSRAVVGGAPQAFGCGHPWENRQYVEFSKSSGQARNHHPTVKATALMRYLCRLVTPPDGSILDPFCGSGSTGKGAMLEGFRFVGIEIDPDYCEIARRRIGVLEAVPVAEPAMMEELRLF